MNAQEFRIQAIIQQLKQIEVDGETMQYILQQVGMDEQMLKQLMMTEPMYLIEQHYEERKELNTDMRRYWLYESC